MTSYYNEIEPYAAAWLRNLIAEGLIAPGEVDERSIEDVRPSDLAAFTQCHFFAGIGVWSLALRRAGWPDDRPVWTGSCPCQPFSSAGKGGGFADERHLWPAFHHLIRVCRPDVVLGEQVASRDGLAWLDLVQADMEGEGYAFGAVDTCAAGFGAPHIRQRLYWSAVAVEHAPSDGRIEWRPEPSWRSAAIGRGADDWMVDSDSRGRSEIGRYSASDRKAREGQARDRLSDGSANGEPLRMVDAFRPGPTNGLWRDPDWIFCRDGKWRPVEPGTFPLAHGAPARVGRLRAYGNAVTLGQAQAFVEAVVYARRVRLTGVSDFTGDAFS